MSTAHDQANAALNEALHQHAVEVDTELARIWATEDRYRQLAISEENNRNRYQGRFFSQEDLDKYLAKVEEAKAEAKPYVEDWLASGMWSRYFLVLNSGGHIHSTMACNTCFNTTRFSWLPDMSGLTEADAVEAYGGILCSVCFPSAPVEWTEGVSKATQAERDARAVAKAERQAKKIAKALVPEDPDGGLPIDYLAWTYRRTPDGQTERVQAIRTDHILTIHAAKAWVTDSMGYAREADGEYSVENVTKVLKALAARLGTDEATEAIAARKRYDKRS